MGNPDRQAELQRLYEEAITAYDQLYHFKTTNTPPSAEEIETILELQVEKVQTLYRALIASGEVPQNPQRIRDLHPTNIWSALKGELRNHQGETGPSISNTIKISRVAFDHFFHDMRRGSLLDAWDLFFLKAYKNLRKLEKTSTAPPLEADLAFARERYAEIAKNPEAFIRLMGGSVECLLARFKDEQGEEIPCEDLNVEEITQTIATLLKLRFYQGEELPISIDVNISPDFKLRANYGMITSVIYNAVKNSFKALLQARQDNPSEEGKPAQIVVQAFHDKRLGVSTILFCDNGCGFDVIATMRQAYDMIQAGMEEQLKAVSPNAYRILKRWGSNPLAALNLKIRDILQCNFANRLGGFNVEGVSSSGQGLAGLKYMIEALGGKVEAIPTADGRTVFAIVLPDDCGTNSESGRIRTLSRQQAFNAISKALRPAA